MSLFNFGQFTLHSGGTTDFKIDCNFLTDEDIAALARLIAKNVWFEEVVGVPTGGLRLAAALQPYRRPLGAMLIVDDVLTTGASMETMRAQLLNDDSDMPIIGQVIWARGPLPKWVGALFTY